MNTQRRKKFRFVEYTKTNNRRFVEYTKKNKCRASVLRHTEVNWGKESTHFELQLVLTLRVRRGRQAQRVSLRHAQELVEGQCTLHGGKGIAAAVCWKRALRRWRMGGGRLRSCGVVGGGRGPECRWAQEGIRMCA